MQGKVGSSILGMSVSLPSGHASVSPSPPPPHTHHSAAPTCLPVHSGVGLRMAGMGTVPSQSSRFMMMFMNTSLGMNESRLVMRRAPSSVSCTMPMTGLLAWGG